MRYNINHLAQCLGHDKHSSYGPFPTYVMEENNCPELRSGIELCPLNTDYLRVCVSVVMRIR